MDEVQGRIIQELQREPMPPSQLLARLGHRDDGALRHAVLRLLDRGVLVWDNDRVLRLAPSQSEKEA